MKVLFIIPRLDYSGAAKQLRLLAANLPRDRFERCICVLSREGPWGESLRKAGVRVETLGWQRWLDLNALARLRWLVREFRPDMVHAWQSAALRAIGPVGANGGRLMMSAPPAAMNRLDRWLLHRVERVIVSGPAQAERCRRGGMPQEKLLTIPPAVEIELNEPRPLGSDDFAPLQSRLVFPHAKARCLACVGPLHAHKGFRDAVWVLDILRYLDNGLHLLLIGDGPDRPRLRRFIQDSQTGDRVHMLGAQEDVPDWLRRAEIVWVPSRAPAGMNVALEAMAAGRPVVASHLPELAEVVLDGQTGFLVPPGDKMALARQTQVLLENAELRRRFGKAGRQRARRHFAVADLVRRFADLYENQRG